MHVKGLLSIKLVVLVVILLLNGVDFHFHEENIFEPVFSVSLEETLCSCPSDILPSMSKEVPV
jgi:hypothetical protein